MMWLIQAQAKYLFRGLFLYCDDAIETRNLRFLFKIRNMKRAILALLFFVFTIFSCTKTPDYCADAIDELTSQTFDGTIYVCNATPTMEFLDGTATINAISPSQISVHVVSDNASVDTTLEYSIDCSVVESDIPVVDILDGAGNSKGQYNQQPDRITFFFDNNSCTSDTFFEGLVP